jgi:hypothetical protein
MCLDHVKQLFPKSIPANTTLRTVFCLLALTVGAGCASFHNRVSSRSWSQTAKQDQDALENPNQTSIFGGN